jgi:nitrate reductase gamma subunit
MSKNFNRQKFTSLKKVKATEQVEPKSEISPNVDLSMDESIEPNLTIDSPVDSPLEINEETPANSKTRFKEKVEQFEKESFSSFERKFSFKLPKKGQIRTISSKKPKKTEKDTDKLLNINTIIFFIGLLGIIVQFIAFILIVLLELEALLTFSWTGLMAITLIAGFIGIVCLIATFVLAMIYKKECRKNGVEPKRGRWYSMWITSIILAAIFLGNFIVTFLIFMNEFFV